MEVCGMKRLGDFPKDAPEDGDDDNFLKDVPKRVVELIWHDPRVNKILASDEDQENLAYTCYLCKTGKFTLPPRSQNTNVHVTI